MSARFGDRTRSGDPVSGSGRRAEMGGTGQAYNEETFLAPGTWTWPGNVTHVEVLLVGGGGGGGSAIIPPAPLGGFSGAGGGGGVRLELDVPVSAPVPVTVGSGGAGGTGSNGMGQIGGTTSFGPISVGGGGGGANANAPVPTQPQRNAPPTGGGGGGSSTVGQLSPISLSRGTGGLYGTNAYSAYGGGAGSTAGTTRTSYTNPAGPQPGLTSTATFGSQGRYGYGYGGMTNGPSSVFPASPIVPTAGGVSAAANTGAGGNSWNGVSPTPLNGGAGGSGIVIVRWWE